MAFKVSYRGNNGAQQSIIIDAASRPQLFAELQKRGISAIRVEETTGKPKKAKPAPSTPSPHKPSPFRGLIAGLIVIALAVAAWFYLLPTLEQVKAKKSKKPSLIAEVAPEIAVTPNNSPVSPDNAAKGRSASAAATTAATESNSLLPDSAASAETERRPRKEPALKLETDQLISMATSIPQDVPVPPLPVMSDSDTDKFIEALSTPIEMDEKDSDDVRRLKESVQSIRLEIAQIMQADPNLTLSEILNEHREIANHNTKCRSDVIDEINELVEAGDLESACRVRDTMNIAFQQIGVPELEMPITPEEKTEAGAPPEEDFAD